LGRFHEFGENLGLGYSHIGQDFTIKFDSGLMQAIHEPTVSNTIETSRGVDAGDPKSPKITLAVAAVGEGVGQGMGHALMSPAPDVIPLTSMALG